MDLVEDVSELEVSMVAACLAVGLSRATLYRATRPPMPPTVHQRAPSPRRLGDDERQGILDVMHGAEFLDQPPMEVFAKLLSRGVYLASIRTIYRVLAELGESKERRNQRSPHPYVKPSLTATASNQVWTWDITKLATLERGVFLHAYVIIDLFSRYVVGWMVAAKECKHLAAQLFADSVARHGIEPGLTVHSDRGAAMKSDTLAQLLATLGASQSFSRPHVSDDNAFSEAQFKTLKYQPDYPGLFTGMLHARGWLELFLHVAQTTTISTPDSRSSRRRKCSSGASPPCTPCDRKRSTPHTRCTQAVSPMARPRRLCRPRRCTSTRSRRSLSRWQ